MITVQITGNASAEIQRLLGKVSNTEPLMKGISLELLSMAEEAFEDEGSPSAWASLAASTIAQRSKCGTWPGRILQESGKLAASVLPFSSNTEAGISAGAGDSAAYAMIHQFGGQAGRNKAATIPARPYLPLVGSADDARLTDDAHDRIMEMVLDFMRP